MSSKSITIDNNGTPKNNVGRPRKADEEKTQETIEKDESLNQTEAGE